MGGAVLAQVLRSAWAAPKAVDVVGYPRGGGRHGGHYGGGERNAELSGRGIQTIDLTLNLRKKKSMPGSLYKALAKWDCSGGTHCAH